MHRGDRDQKFDVTDEIVAFKRTLAAAAATR